MASAQSKAVSRHRARLSRQGWKRIEVVVRSRDAGLLRELAAVLRRDDPVARQLRDATRQALGHDAAPSIADVIRSLPDVSGPEFDDAFVEIERLRQEPAPPGAETAVRCPSMSQT
jgi:hypothetical protein